MKSSFNDTIALFMAKSKNRTGGHFENDVVLFFFLFLFDFVNSNALWLLFYSLFTFASYASKTV